MKSGLRRNKKGSRKLKVLFLSNCKSQKSVAIHRILRFLALGDQTGEEFICLEIFPVDIFWQRNFVSNFPFLESFCNRNKQKKDDLLKDHFNIPSSGQLLLIIIIAKRIRQNYKKVSRIPEKGDHKKREEENPRQALRTKEGNENHCGRIPVTPLSYPRFMSFAPTNYRLLQRFFPSLLQKNSPRSLHVKLKNVL